MFSVSALVNILLFIFDEQKLLVNSEQEISKIGFLTLEDSYLLKVLISF